jgi:hypothetical protein
MEERRGAYRVLVGRPERKRPLGRSWYMWDNIKMDIREIRLESVDWSSAAQNVNKWHVLENAVR